METINFANWINNNWYVPTGTDYEWKKDITHPNFDHEIPSVNLFTTEDLYKKFKNKEEEF